ncbi:MAG: peptide chain release factor 1, partial [Alphaproteobacteria bacterium]|nr:peptide chain release factor 1 [Alphaproteobacteria bacterium]
MSIEAKLDGVVARHEEIKAQMAASDLDPRVFQRLAKEYS